MPRCYNCEKEGELKHCSGCQHAFYCSKACQKKHWEKHKPTCLPPESPIHTLFEACAMDVFPAPSIDHEYGFDNMRLYHADVLWGASSMPASAEQILLSLYELIYKDVGNLELGDTIHTFNSIGASKKIIVEAYEKNALDEFIHRYVSNVISRHGRASPQYCFAWLWNRLVIGPTRTEGLSQQQVQKMRKEIYHKYYGSTEPANCCCLSRDQMPTVRYHMPF